MKSQLVEVSRSVDRGALVRRGHGARVAKAPKRAQVVDAHVLAGLVAVARGEIVGALSAPEASRKAG